MLLAAASLVSLTGCGPKTTPSAEAEPARNAFEISPGPDLAKQIKIGPCQWQAVSGILRVAGRVEADATRMARVSAPVTGRIVELNAIEGQQVAKGEVLATIYSTELSSAQSSMLKAASQRQVAERAVSRAKHLLEAGVIGSAELQRREAELQQASADLAAAREQLRVLGLSEASIEAVEASRRVNSVTQIVATIDGIVLERTATAGQIVQAVEPVFTIADLSHVWLIADVPEQSAGAITTGKAVEAEIPALPGHKITGKLSFVSAMVDPETRTVRTRMNLPNPRRIYKPAMLTNMALVDGRERKLVVPSAAVVREGNGDYVFVKTGSNTFLLRPVKLGEEVGDFRVLVDGIRDGEEIVLDGAFHLNNERKRLALGSGEGN
jgi:cobalt-zinc-cadmium efflux system membrane fusion protein